MFHRSTVATATTALALLAGAARADEWVTAEVPAAIAMSSPQDSNFHAGAMPAFGAYLGLVHNVSVGLRMRFGALANSPDHAANLQDPDKGGLVAAMLALRYTLGSTWLEVDCGGGETGHDKVPTFEVGVGHTFTAGPVELGPMVRFLQVVGGSTTMIEQGSASIVLFGLEASYGRKHERRLVDDTPVFVAERDVDRVETADAACSAAADPVAAGCQPPDRDHDGIPDAVDKCPDQPETVNGVDDTDGCPDEGLFEVHDDRIVLEERVLFDLNRARIKHSGKAVIQAIADAWRQHPEWEHMSVEGHCDVRGPDSFNDWLSKERASRVRDALIEAGMSPERIDAAGFGATKPVDPGTTEEAHAHNRRVEFAITRAGGHQ